MTDTAASTPASTPGAPGVDGGAGTPLSPAELEIVTRDVQELVKKGRMTTDQANAVLKEAGGAPISAADTRTEAAKEIDEAFPPAPKLSDYEMPQLAPHGQNWTPEMKALDQQGRQWLADARFPKEIGGFIAKEIDRVSTKTAGMTAAERQLFDRSQRQILERMWGDDFGRRFGLARQLLAEIEAKRPGLKEILDRTGAGSSAMVVAQFWTQAERLAARRAG